VAVRSLCDDQLLPYGRIVRKRLGELAVAVDEQSFAEIEMSHLRLLCGKSSKLHVESEGEADWSATVIDEPATFIDIYSSKDDYSVEFWSMAEAYFEGLQEDEMNCPGGRYECAKNLVALDLAFLAAYSLGQVCHIVQIAMTQRKLLGYRNGAIVPYNHSQTRVKEQCAEQNQLCRKAKMPLASWDVLRHFLWTVLPRSGPEGLALSNVKRMLRAEFRVDLSETALGHSSVCDLFKDGRLRDSCHVQLCDNGYYLMPALPEAVGMYEAPNPHVVAAPVVNAGFQPTQGQTVPLPATGEQTFACWGHSLPSSCMFSTTPLQPGFMAVPLPHQGVPRAIVPERLTQYEQQVEPKLDTAASDLMCGALRMPCGAGNQNVGGQTQGPVPPPQSPPEVVAAHHDVSDVDSENGRSESCSGAVASILSTAPTPPSLLCQGLMFPSLLHNMGEGSDAGSSLNTTWQGDNGSSSGDADSADAISNPSSTPPSPYVPIAVTPSPFVHFGGTFSQMLFAAAHLDDNTDKTFTHVDKSSSRSESFDCSLSMPATPSIVVADTPSPYYEQSFSRLLCVANEADDSPLGHDSMETSVSQQSLPTQNASPCQDCTETAGSGPAAAREQLKQAIEQELSSIADLELKIARGEILSNGEVSKLLSKSDLLLEVNMLAGFSCA
jgi:hypothetical protein